MRAWRPSRRMMCLGPWTQLLALLALPAGPLLAQGGAGAGELTVHFHGLRSEKGHIRACLTRNSDYFLHCERDPAAMDASVAAGPEATLKFANVPPGTYALAVMHDENDNEKVDTFIGIPREGVGFSRDPAMRFGPPKWDKAHFAVAKGPNEMNVTLKYFF